MNALFDIDNWREIGATLKRNKTRTFLTAFGIFWGTAMLAMLLGGAGGLRGMISRNFDGFATNMIGMFPGRTTVSYRGFNKGMSWQLKQHDLDVMRQQIPEIDASTPQLQASGPITYKDKSRTASILGAESDLFKIQLPTLYDGRLLNRQDDIAGEKVAVIGKDIASEFFGMESAVGKYVNANGVYVKIVGVIGQKSEANFGDSFDRSLVMPASVMRRAYGLGDDIGFIALTLKSGKHLDDVKDRIYRTIRANHPISPDDDKALIIFDVSEMFRQVEGVFIAVNLLALFVGLGTLIAGIIGVGNIMWIIVKERTQEIGIRRAIGARPRDIIMQILSEGMVLTTIAGLAGIVFAAAVLAVADMMTTDPFHGSAGFNLAFSDAISIMLTFMILGTAAGLIPALKAMKIKPIEALNDK